MSDLPEGWAETTLNAISSYIQRGKSPKYTDKSDLPVINQKAVRWWGIDEAALKFVHPDQWDKWGEERFLVEGDILWNSTGTGTIGRACLYTGLETSNRAVVDSHVTVVRSAGEIEPGYVFNYIRSPAVQSRIEEMQSGSTNQVELGKGAIQETVIPLPPAPEQKRIVAKIDSLTAKSARARTELTKIEALVERYKAAVIDTEISRAEKAAQSEHSIEEIAASTFDGPFGSNLKSADYVEAGKRVIRLENIGHFAFIGSKETFISKEKFLSLERHHLKADDILFSSFISDNIRVCRLPADLDGQALNKADCFAIRLNRAIALPRYIMFALGSTKAYDALSGSVHGATRPRINLKQLKSYAIPLAPISTQNVAIARIEAALRHIDQVVQEVRGSATALDRIDQQILSKAFSGALVPQDPADEPAAELLARIKAARKSAPKKPRQRRQGGKTKVSPIQKIADALETWPESGRTFEDIREVFPGTYEAQKDAIFELLTSDPPRLRQEFDEDDQIIKLKKA
ncbi:restriction endonuclease subunit S [Oceanicaulis sp. LC35]|uniref:restriction endonuclease subunit S n=1 Tax=Oceanicaulis sp. LC35 TaxID=3349635 RepID=UPI003F877264